MVPVKQQAANAQDEIQKYTEMKIHSSCPYLLIIRGHFPANEKKRNLKISHKNMNVNFKYKDSCSQKPDQDETILSSIKIYKIDKNAALATIIFLLIQYFFIVIKKK